jgi:hypothetical protein
MIQLCNAIAGSHVKYKTNTIPILILIHQMRISSLFSDAQVKKCGNPKKSEN